jgi:hypothetical protein
LTCAHTAAARHGTSPKLGKDANKLFCSSSMASAACLHGGPDNDSPAGFRRRPQCSSATLNNKQRRGGTQPMGLPPPRLPPATGEPCVVPQGERSRVPGSRSRSVPAADCTTSVVGADQRRDSDPRCGDCHGSSASARHSVEQRPARLIPNPPQTAAAPWLSLTSPRATPAMAAAG